MKTVPLIHVHVFRPSGFIRGVPIVRATAVTIPAPWRIAARRNAGYRAGLQIVKALPDGAIFVEVVDSKNRQLAAWKPVNTGRYTGTNELPPHYTEWVPA